MWWFIGMTVQMFPHNENAPRIHLPEPSAILLAGMDLPVAGVAVIRVTSCLEALTPNPGHVSLQ